ncbi:MerR family DNA-binding protein [Streptomyces sp. P17]|uniref:MerR family DNA-binding protein n=1 Tax=Streptomyces sp. P17 TaxID=3074716 RepID=UPI0028F4202B|nr:MerR family DNA-binding protein [Streptomyces sp. P17]MDT9698304.1 MerR family DNA-binding protein [Streptomyces sp. P17]
MGRTAGFSLDEIAHMFAPDGQPRIDRRMLASKADELERRIRELGVRRDSLRHAAACPAPETPRIPHLPPPAQGRGVRRGRPAEEAGSGHDVDAHYVE